MLAGCSSTLLSLRHRLRSEADDPFQACHFQLQADLSSSTMNTQRLDLPCNFSRKTGSQLRLSLDKAIEAAGSCSFRPQNPKAPSSSSALIAHGSKRRFHERGDDQNEGMIKSKKLKNTTTAIEGSSWKKIEPETGSSDSSDYPPARESPEHGGAAKKLARQGIELVGLLTACVEAIGSRNHEATTFFLSRLGELSSPSGSVIHRVAAYFTEALALHVARLWPAVFTIAPRRELLETNAAAALRVLNDVSPVLKFIHFTINERILKQFQGTERIHIIDFDIKQGLQWPSLLQSLASRPCPPTQVRITGVGELKQELQETGARLSAFAEALNLPFEFHPVVDRLEDVRLWMLHVKEKDSIAVNCVLQLHKLLYDDGRSVGDFLSLIRSTNPEIVLMAEQEAGNNSSRWEERFASSLEYYSALFDLVDYSLPPESQARTKVEEMFADEIRNIVCGVERERVERHEGFAHWKKRMVERGFRCAGIGERERLLNRMLLRMYACSNYGLETQEEGEDGEAAGLTLRWLDQPLYTVSAWRI